MRQTSRRGYWLLLHEVDQYQRFVCVELLNGSSPDVYVNAVIQLVTKRSALSRFGMMFPTPDPNAVGRCLDNGNHHPHDIPCHGLIGGAEHSYRNIATLYIAEVACLPPSSRLIIVRGAIIVTTLPSIRDLIG